MRESGWLLVGPDRNPRRLILVRLQERMDGSGTWTVECFHHGEIGEPDRKSVAEFADEATARSAVEATYREFEDVGRWRVTRYLPDSWTHERYLRVPTGGIRSDGEA
jgi:hypothetical protein